MTNEKILKPIKMLHIYKKNLTLNNNGKKVNDQYNIVELIIPIKLGFFELKCIFIYCTGVVVL